MSELQQTPLPLQAVPCGTHAHLSPVHVPDAHWVPDVQAPPVAATHAEPGYVAPRPAQHGVVALGT